MCLAAAQCTLAEALFRVGLGQILHQGKVSEIHYTLIRSFQIDTLLKHSSYHLGMSLFHHKRCFVSQSKDTLLKCVLFVGDGVKAVMLGMCCSLC